MTKGKRVLISVGVFTVSILLFLIWTGFDPEAFLIDDNRTQWFPVIERAYSDFYSTGHISIYDFFQFKGLPIVNPGYYSIMNPFMLIAYVISHYLLRYFSTITVYMALIFGLGNVVFFRLCRELGNSNAQASFLTLCYSTMSSFFSFGYWYYAINNALMIPLLIYVFIKSKDRKIGFISCGIILALDVLMGNVQYTVYHYMIYGIIGLCFIISSFRKHITRFVSNCLFAIVLSAPFLLLMLKASTGFINDSFHVNKIPVTDQIVGSFFPAGIVGFFGPLIPIFPKALSRVDYTWLYNGSFAVSGLCLIIIICKKAWQNRGLFNRDIFKKIRIKDDRHLLLAGVVISVLFFVSFLSDSAVATVLGHLPVIKSFRFLFKCLFIIQPLMGVLTAVAFPLIGKKDRKWVLSLMSVFLVIGLINNYMVIKTVHQFFRGDDALSISEEAEYGDTVIEACIPDSDMYRSMTVIQKHLYDAGSYRYYNGFWRNFSTTEELYSIYGYDPAAPLTHIQSCNMLISEDGWLAKLYGAAVVDEFVLERDSEALRHQIRSNAVRYIFVEEDFDVSGWDPDTHHIYPESMWSDNTEYTSMICDYLEENGIDVLEVRNANVFNVIVLSDAQGICIDDEGTAIALTPVSMDLLRFEAAGAPYYRLSFTYDEHLVAYGNTGDGTEYFQIDPDDDIIVHVPDGFEGTVNIGYRDPICSIGFVVEFIIVLLAVSDLIMLTRGRKEKGI